MELAVERFLALSLLVTGLSHALQPRAWIELFIRLRGLGDGGILLVALMHLPFGLLIVTFHNVWHGPGTVVTLLGWGLTLKGSLYFFFPAVGRWGLRRVAPGRAFEFILAGLAATALAVFIAWHASPARQPFTP